MRIWWTLLALAGFLQPYVGCEGECPCCRLSAAIQQVRPPVDYASVAPTSSHEHDESEPHFCVATHVYYVTRGYDNTPQPDLDASAVGPFAGTVAVSALALQPTRGLSLRSAPPLSAQRARAQLGAWTL